MLNSLTIQIKSTIYIHFGKLSANNEYKSFLVYLSTVSQDNPIFGLEKQGKRQALARL